MTVTCVSVQVVEQIVEETDTSKTITELIMSDGTCLTNGSEPDNREMLDTHQRDAAGG